MKAEVVKLARGVPTPDVFFLRTKFRSPRIEEPRSYPVLSGLPTGISCAARLLC
jgi:hypothetical protein